MGHHFGPSWWSTPTSVLSTPSRVTAARTSDCVARCVNPRLRVVHRFARFVDICRERTLIRDPHYVEFCLTLNDKGVFYLQCRAYLGCCCRRITNVADVCRTSRTRRGLLCACRRYARGVTGLVIRSSTCHYLTRPTIPHKLWVVSFDIRITIHQSKFGEIAWPSCI